ncbi:hypothetical protein [Streptococcus oralis]|nr:hypothetical protein [Streptococcus oralis]
MHSAVRTYRIISSVSLLILRESYPMGRASTPTSLMPQLVQAVIDTRHVVLANFYIIERKYVKVILE